MKKQKKPFFLVLFVLVLLGGVAWMNRPPSDNSPAPPPPDASAQTKKEDVAAQVSGQIKNDKPVAHDKKADMMKNSPLAKIPSILKFHAPTVKQKPSDSSTSTQWYTKQTGKG